MKKLISLTLAISLIFIAACSNSGTAPSGTGSSAGKGEQAGDAAKKKTVLKMNMVASSSDKTYTYWQDFAKELTEASKGTLEVQIYPTETLGKTTDTIQAISYGAPILQDSDPSHLADYVPDFSIFMHPYLFKKPEDIEKAWKSDIGQNLSRKLEEKGLKIVTLVYFGTRHLISGKEVVTRDDTKNMKIRNAPTKMWNEVTKVLGGNPTNTAWSEVYTALSQGVADAAESPLSLLYSSKLYEAKKHISLTGHLVATTSIVMSKQVYDSLPAEAKKAIDEVGQAYPAKRAKLITDIEKEFRQKLETEGVKFNEVKKEGFIEASKSVSKSFPEWTPGLYDSMLKAIQ
ncbi:DctP family TRAP transporter solute-binding subunit [Paenibacillus thalictri]|uniref:DctP family TRAP transporter solute-binding subunit n=1 Tax=Paenibacillus thalictri TaxID=2527873 RepID=A0A4V2J356_9BACL|nr:DctP family TRAP transporter solute-binding subunit [Paenibacillus thalictri]TBL69891.1 DctP family TRAP transporter solute-binding subunit [Paenibacillus thalictri]